MQSEREGLSILRHSLVAGIALTLFLGAMWVLHRELANIHFSEVAASFHALSWHAIATAAVFAAASYAALVGYDWLALRHIGRSLPLTDIALISLVATAIGNNLGIATLSAGAVRYRFYGKEGLLATEIATVVAMIGLTFGLGVTFVTGLVLLLAPSEAVPVVPLSQGSLRLLGGLLILILAAYITWTGVRRKPLRLRGWQLPLPHPSTTALQITIATIDLALAAAVLYALLPTELGVTYVRLLGVFVLAILAGIISHVPGGLGVFESVLLLSLPDAPRGVLLGSILAYRVIYYLVPLAFATLLGLGNELAERWVPVRRGARRGFDLLGAASPQLVSALVFVSGAVLVFSGATPAVPERAALLGGLMPLPLLEVSHLAGSLAGLVLMVLAYNLGHRVSAAWYATCFVLIVGILASLAKGLDYEEATLAGLALVVLYAGRREFYRPATLLTPKLSPGWIALVCMAVAGSLWLGLFAYREVEYSSELWWQIALDGDAPRFLRASLVLAIALSSFALFRLLRSRSPEPELPDSSALERVADIVRNTPHSDAALALLGDKRLLLDPGGNGFVMYQVRGRSWIAMGDPVGSRLLREQLAWRFRELSDLHNGRTIFYQVDAENLPLYVDMGLALLKLGEEALVPLDGFSLQGSERADLRQAYRRGQREGAEFEVVEPGQVASLMPQLERISERWLQQKNTREKGFALGRFEPRYISRCSCALVRVGGEIVAFANLWTGDGRSEFSVDLMRYTDAAPKTSMDYLFTELLLWGAAKGYRYLNLGMAPLSGLEAHPLAPLWHRVGTLIFRHGEHFYNFEGLRAYKAKFRPEWKPKYLAAPRGPGLPAVLLDISALISGGLRGILTR